MTRCKKCGHNIFLSTCNVCKKPITILGSSDGQLIPFDEIDGQYVSHFQTCTGPQDQNGGKP